MQLINFYSYLTLLATILWLSSWLIPDHIPPWESFYNEFSAFVALGILLLANLNINIKSKLIIPRSTLIILLLACAPALQVAVGLVKFGGDGFLASLYLIAFAIAYALGHTQTAEGKTPITTLIATFFSIGATLSAFIAIYQSLGLSGQSIWINAQDPSSRVIGNIGQPNQLASLLCLGLAGIAYLHSTRRLNAITSLLITSILIYAITLTQSRMPWVIAIFALLWWMYRGRLTSGISATGLGYALLLYLTLVLAWPMNYSTTLPAEITQRSDLTAPGSRLEMWSGLLKAALQQPWLGYGWNQVSTAHSQIASNYPLPEMVTYSHNLLIDLIIWNGLPIGLLTIALIGWWFITRASRSGSKDSWFGMLAIGMVGAHGLLEYPHAYAYFLLPVGLLAGMVDADQKTVGTMQVSKPLLYGVLAAYISLMILIWHEYQIVEEDYRLARFETRNIGPIKAAHDAPDLLLLTQLREDLRFMRTTMHENMSPEELAWAQKVAYRYPYFANLFRYSLALALNNKTIEANAELIRILNMYGQPAYDLGLEYFQELANSTHPQLQPILEAGHF